MFKLFAAMVLAKDEEAIKSISGENAEVVRFEEFHLNDEQTESVRIAIEGPDGVGKTRISSDVSEILTRQLGEEWSVVNTREPSIECGPTFLEYNMDRQRNVLPVESLYDVAVKDRSVISSVAYNLIRGKGGSKVEDDVLEAMRASSFGAVPDLTFVIIPTSSWAFENAKRKGDFDEEREYELLVRAYAAIAVIERGCKIIMADSHEQARSEILCHFEDDGEKGEITEAILARGRREI